MRRRWIKKLENEDREEKGEIRVYLTKRRIVSVTDRVEGFTVCGKTYLFERPAL